MREPLVDRARAHARAEPVRPRRATDGEIASLTLVQPPSHGRISGGYLFNREMLWRLRRDGYGKTINVPRGELDTVEREHRDQILLLDSLYLNDNPTHAADLFNASLRRRGTCLLLHYLPSSDPNLDEAERADARRRELDWLQRVDRVITTSQASADHVASLCAITPRVVQPGVSDVFRSARIGPSPNANLQLVTVGSLCAGKNQLFVLRCLAPSRARGFVWNLVGDFDADPDYVQRFREAVRESGLEAQVRLWGPLDHTDIALLYNRSHLYVSASRFESYGMATAEAACHGIPALCFDVGACGEWIDHGTNGLLYDMDDGDGFRHGLGRLMADRVALDDLERPSPASRHGKFPTWEQSYRSFVDAVFG